MPESLSGVVLAGGRSRRMGRDKAFLTVGGETLVQWQVALLRSAGCDEVMVSGRAGVDYGVPGARVVYDPVENAGPLAGLVAALVAMKNDRLLVLAVDLPRMTKGFLERLAAAGDAQVSVVAHGLNGYEPLGACYARSMLGPARAALARGEFSLQALIGRAEAVGLVSRLAPNPGEEGIFANWNSPEDLGR